MKPKKKIQTFETLASGTTALNAKADVLAFGAHPDDVEIAMAAPSLHSKRRAPRSWYAI